MAYDEGMAEQMRADLAEDYSVSERKMFGGLCFMLNGHMVCGVTADGAMFRVGKQHEATALAIAGVDPLSFTGRKMGGMVECDAQTYGDDASRAALTELAVQNALSLPPKGQA